MTPGDIRLVPAVERASAILDLVAEAATPPTLSEIARALGLPKSSTHGLCHTLCALRLLSEDRGGYLLGPHLLQWAQAALDQNDIAREFTRLLGDFPELSRYTITLSTLEGAEVVYTSCRNSAAPLGVTFRIGMRLPAAFTATGKAMIAHLDRPARDALLATPLPPPLTPRSVASRAALEAELGQILLRGFSVDDGQVRPGMTCLGAAILNAARQPVAGVALSMTEAEATEATVADTGRAIAAFARRLSEAAGLTRR